MKILTLIIILFSSSVALCAGPSFFGKTGGFGKTGILSKGGGRAGIAAQIGSVTAELIQDIINVIRGGSFFGDDEEVVLPESWVEQVVVEATDPDLIKTLIKSFKEKVPDLARATATVKKPKQAAELLRTTYVPLVFGVVPFLTVASSDESASIWIKLIKKLEPIRQKLEDLVKKNSSVAKQYSWIPVIDGFVTKMLNLKTAVKAANDMTTWMQRPENGKNFYPTDEWGFTHIPGVLPPEFLKRGPTLKQKETLLKNLNEYKRTHPHG